jgi:hypothetical protein
MTSDFYRAMQGEFEKSRDERDGGQYLQVIALIEANASKGEAFVSGALTHYTIQKLKSDGFAVMHLPGGGSMIEWRMPQS